MLLLSMFKFNLII